MINLNSGLHKALFKYYFANPDAEHYLRELSRILSFDVAHLSQELNRFVREGIFTARTDGQKKFFRLNRRHPFFGALKSIIVNIE